MRPKFCPNCAAALPEGSHGAQDFTCYSSEGESGGCWDCYCDACKWSGDILPDDEDSETNRSK